MKKLLLSTTFLIAYGCSHLGDTSLSVSSGCPEKPIASLSEKDVKEISLNQQTLTESGQASTNKSVGYKFEAQSGQQLSYQTKDDICVWVYTPDNQIISDRTLPQTGKYILQVSAPKGTTTFDLAISFGTLQPSLNPATTSSYTTSNLGATEFSQPQAEQIIQNWLNSKSEVFAPPFNLQLVEKYTTGELYNDITKPDGSIAWLQSNNYRYSYRDARITQVFSFSNSGSQPSIKVRIFEDRTLYGPHGIDRTTSGASTTDYVYFFAQNNGFWKIYDYKKAE